MPVPERFPGLIVPPSGFPLPELSSAQPKIGASGHQAPEHRPARLPSDAGVLFYDGECTFCQRSVQFLQRYARRPIVAVPSSAFSQNWPRELRQAAEEEVIWINARGEAVGGILAVAAALRAAGRGWLASLLTFPPLLPFTRTVYRWVARNRYRFSSACAVDLRKPPIAPIDTARKTTLLPKPSR